jgi:hypothetical protein
MEFGELNAVAQNKEFAVFNTAELVVGIAVPGEKKPTLMGQTSTSRCFRNGLCEMQRRWNLQIIRG